MNLATIDGIEIKVVAWDPSGSMPVAENWLDIPGVLGPDNVEDYVIERFGTPCPLVDDEALRDRLPPGWLFDGDALAGVGLPSGDLLMVAVPFVRFPDGRRLELSEYRAQLGHHFRDLVATIDPSVEVGAAPDERPTRLHDEHLSIATTSAADIELQVGGWLRRMVRERSTYLVIDIPDSGRYVQFVTEDGDWLRAEAVGDRYLGGHPPLSTHERRGLRDLGWNAPDEDDEHGGNYWLEWNVADDDTGLDSARHPVSWIGPEADQATVPDAALADAARLAAMTLCDVFGPLELDQLVTQSGTVHLD